jgi:hypothetical protein
VPDAGLDERLARLSLLEGGSAVSSEIGSKIGDPYYSTQAGNIQTLVTPDDVNKPRRILQPNIGDVEPGKKWEAGAWVLTARTEADLDPALSIVNPLIARVALGDGSATTPVEIDIANGAAIQFPSGYLQVDLVLQQAPPGFITPPTQKVTATLHRGFSSSRASRSFYFTGPLALPVGNFVPSGAKEVRGYGTALTGATTLFFFSGSTLATVLASYTDVDLAAANIAGHGLNVPGAASSWALAGLAPGLATIEFEISL